MITCLNIIDKYINKYLLCAFLLMLCGCTIPQYDPEEKNDFAANIVADNAEDLIDIVNATGADFELGHFCYREIKRSLNDAELGYRVRLQSKKIQEQWGADQDNGLIESLYNARLKIVLTILIWAACMICCYFYLRKGRAKWTRS